MRKIFGMKTLEKKMSFDEVTVFLDEHPKYRLLDFEELSAIGDVSSFIDNETEVISDGEFYKYVWSYASGEKNKTGTKIKLPVVVAYSSDYLKFIAKLIVEKGAEEIAIFIPKSLREAPIYFTPNGLSFEPIQKENYGK